MGRVGQYSLQHDKMYSNSSSLTARNQCNMQTQQGQQVTNATCKRRGTPCMWCGDNKLVVHGYWTAVKRCVLDVARSQNGSHKAPIGLGGLRSSWAAPAVLPKWQWATSPQSPCPAVRP